MIDGRGMVLGFPCRFDQILGEFVETAHPAIFGATAGGNGFLYD